MNKKTAAELVLIGALVLVALTVRHYWQHPERTNPAPHHAPEAKR